MTTSTGPMRRTTRVTSQVRRSTLAEDFALVVESTSPARQLRSWIADNHAAIRADLHRYGAVLFRGFAVDGPAGFGSSARAVSPVLLDYLERAAPRQEVAPGVFTSTEMAADQWIPLHHEMSYAHNWPTLLYFYCDVAATRLGATPLASERTVLPLIPAEIRERFVRHGVRYVRNYSPELDLPWQQVFQTTDRAEVEAYCRESHTEFAWIGRDGLRTTAVRQATAVHPETGETVWFNHSHLFHLTNLPSDVAAALVGEYGLAGVPRNAYYGDGAVIEDEVVRMIGDLYRDHSVRFDWRAGDVLLVDNFLATHGREPFEGDRRVLVAMSDLYVNSGFSR
ncbi:TauD/TfdA family dioxygenase [Pseudosporangium ferrugineum]|uniref:Alpha-ketoglutarate-dependent taurine dioxygenase n=1 Tax=Pseudosporangium ferrugineum TaxID=439699 RepID=A0A2T0RFH8_9ACTN|nr:TauD/TfdA family dioxygenase [Pseudosporangium ferrugineum]PRY19892.1 alpha-ketoglutarate-dependent taurine dioxygenase [Pseudosporangium ferrugineum]